MAGRESKAYALKTLGAGRFIASSKQLSSAPGRYLLKLPYLLKLGRNTSALHRNRDRLSKFERKWCFRAKVDVLLSREQRDCRPCARPHRSADQRALATAGQCTNQRSAPCATADQRPVPLLM